MSRALAVVRRGAPALIAALVIALAVPAAPATAMTTDAAIRPVAVTETTTGTVTRLAGDNRYETSAAISRASFSPGVSVAYIASGAAFPDALSATARAGVDRAPVLLISATTIPSVIATELTRLKPKRIVVLGGEGAISGELAAALASYTTGSVTRLGGATRYGTSAAVSGTFAPGVPVVYLASGANYPDALAGAAAAARAGGPVLLTAPDAIPDEIAAELTRLKPKKIVILGGEGAVAKSVASRAAALTGAPVSRLEGADRYGTAAAISVGTTGTPVSVAFVATGAAFPDALSGAAAAAVAGAPLLLTKTDTLPAVILAELKRLNPARVVVLGGPSAVASSVSALIESYATSRVTTTSATMSTTSELRAGSCLTSANGQTRLCLDNTAGITVTKAGAVAWRVSVGGGQALRLGANGDLVLYSSAGAALWQTRTIGSSSTQLRVQDDGDVTLRTAGSAITWATMTAASSPVWQLPFEAGEKWSAGGPHLGTSGGSNQTRNALDLGPYATASKRVVTIAAGVVREIDCGNGRSYLRVDHGNGWQSAYYHLVNVQTGLVGTQVAAGTYLGDAGRALPCGGSATFDHVHLSIRYNGTPVSVEGMTFGGYTVLGGEVATSGRYLNAAGKTVISTSRGAVCCLTAPVPK